MTTVVLREQLTADSALFHFSTFLSPVKPTSTQTMDLVCTLTILTLNKHVRLNYSQHISQHFFEMTYLQSCVSRMINSKVTIYWTDCTTFLYSFIFILHMVSTLYPD